MSTFKPTPKLIVGLTGGIGSGKSEVGRRFEKLGVTLVDADFLAHQVVEPGEPALGQIAEHFGREILTDEGRLNRASMRTLIFEHPEEKRWLEELLHPLVNREIRVQLNEAKSPYAILMSPLLLETHQDRMVDRVLVVDSPESEQLSRVTRRDQSKREQIEAIISTQISYKKRLERADDIIRNEGALSELDDQVEKLHTYYLELAGSHHS